jgi:hypothetical protein
MNMSRINCSMDIATGYGLDSRGSILSMDKIFLYSAAFRPALGPNQPPIKWVPGGFHKGKRGRGVKITTHHHLVPR